MHAIWLMPKQPNNARNHQRSTQQFFLQLLLFEQPRTEASCEQHRYFTQRRNVADGGGVHGLEDEDVGEWRHCADGECVLAVFAPFVAHFAVIANEHGQHENGARAV